MTLSFSRRELRALIFDFDGTLAVPALDFALMRRRTLQALAGFVPAPDAPDTPGEGRSPGLPLMEELERIYARLAPEPAAAARQRAMQAIEEVEVEAAKRSALFPFVRPMLAALKQAGVPLAVVTRNCPAAVYTVFPDLDRHCACVLTRDHVTRVKPHPEHMTRALECLGCEAHYTLAVGDHPMDVEAGRRIGAKTAAVASGESSRESLAKAGPDILADNAAQALHMLGFDWPE